MPWAAGCVATLLALPALSVAESEPIQPGTLTLAADRTVSGEVPRPKPCRGDGRLRRHPRHPLEIDADEFLARAALRSAVLLAADALGAASRMLALTVHGAVGYTWEHDLQLFYERAKLDLTLNGAPALWNARIADALESAREVEENSMTHPDIAAIAAVSMPDQKMGEKVCAFIVPEGDARITIEELAAYLQGERRIAAQQLLDSAA